MYLTCIRYIDATFNKENRILCQLKNNRLQIKKIKFFVSCQCTLAIYSEAVKLFSHIFYIKYFVTIHHRNAKLCIYLMCVYARVHFFQIKGPNIISKHVLCRIPTKVSKQQVSLLNQVRQSSVDQYTVQRKGFLQTLHLSTQTN